MSIKNRLKNLEKNNAKGDKCLCVISEVKELITARELPQVCSNCGHKYTEEEKQDFLIWRDEADERLENTMKAVKARM